jgi:hypothetical protein
MSRGQMTMEREQEKHQTDAGLPWEKDSGMIWHTPLCAWCLIEQGLELGNGSHGICRRHASRILQQRKERRFRPR